VFHRITQQVLEYLHVPHDTPLAPQHQLLLAAARTKEKDLEEGTPDHPGEPLETAEVNSDSTQPVPQKENVARAPLRQAQGELSPATADANDGHMVQAAIRQNDPMPETSTGSPPGMGQTTQTTNPSSVNTAPSSPRTGTVVLEVEQGGIEVPSFVGRTVRAAVEAAQDVGLQLEPVGSGIARQQTPAPGTHVNAGSRVTVQFGR
jgi:cell division protein FtsI (penicillin-binding protein 3)